MEGTIDKQDMQNLVIEQKETNKKLTELCLRQTRLISTVETLTANQKEHHETLFDDKSGLKPRVQKIEN